MWAENWAGIRARLQKQRRLSLLGHARAEWAPPSILCFWQLTCLTSSWPWLESKTVSDKKASEITIRQPHHTGEETVAQRVPVTCRSTAGPLSHGTGWTICCCCHWTISELQKQQVHMTQSFKRMKKYRHKQTFGQVPRTNRVLHLPRAFVLTMFGMIFWLSPHQKGPSQSDLPLHRTNHSLCHP